jgi:hypothetical protein
MTNRASVTAEYVAYSSSCGRCAVRRPAQTPVAVMSHLEALFRLTIGEESAT